MMNMVRLAIGICALAFLAHAAQAQCMQRQAQAASASPGYSLPPIPRPPPPPEPPSDQPRIPHITGRPSTGTTGSDPADPEATPPLMLEDEEVTLMIIRLRDSVTEEDVTRRMSRLRGFSDPQIDFAARRMTVRYSGDIEDLPVIESALTDRRTRVYLINPARVALDLREDPELMLDLPGMEAAFYNRCQARRVQATERWAVIWVDLRAVCVCQLVENALQYGYAATCDTVFDAAVWLRGDGDLASIQQAIWGMDGVINLEVNSAGDVLGILSTQRIGMRDLQEAARDAGFEIEMLERPGS